MHIKKDLMHITIITLIYYNKAVITNREIFTIPDYNEMYDNVGANVVTPMVVKCQG